MTGHEFHYDRAPREGPPLFAAQDAAGRDLGEMGLRAGPSAGPTRMLLPRRVTGPARFGRDMGVRGVVERTVPKGACLIGPRPTKISAVRVIFWS